MAIELKPQGVDLEKKQIGRSDNKSPVEKAFGYAISSGHKLFEWLGINILI